jgi:hypothetical protein
MSRASNVYILQRKRDGLILAGWTVKGEMEYWLCERDATHRATQTIEWLKEYYQIVRCQDGRGVKNTTIVPWEDIQLTVNDSNEEKQNDDTGT